MTTAAIVDGTRLVGGRLGAGAGGSRAAGGSGAGGVGTDCAGAVSVLSSVIAVFTQNSRCCLAGQFHCRSVVAAPTGGRFECRPRLCVLSDLGAGCRMPNREPWHPWHL